MGLMTNELNRQIREDTETYGYAIEEHMLNSELKILDYTNGQITSQNGKEKVLTGMSAGKSIMIVGKPGSGKSTLGIQWASSIMKKYDESTMIVFDFEGSNTDARIKSLTGVSDEYYKEHFVLKQVGIYTESVLKLVKQIAEYKKIHKKELLVDNADGIKDAEGNVIKILPPTFVFIDSISAMMQKENMETDELSSLTAGGRNAIMNKDLFKKITQPCLESNIIVIAINQVTQNMSMGVTPPTASTRYLKNTEAVGGGTGVQFMTNLWLNVEAGEKLEPDKKYGIKGFVSKVTIVKSRNSEAGLSCNMVFNQREGFDELLSEFEFLKDNNLIKGAGVGMYLEGLESCKFRMTTIKEKYTTVPEFKAKWDEVVEEALLNRISVSSKLQFDQEASQVEGPMTLNEEVVSEESFEDVTSDDK